MPLNNRIVLSDDLQILIWHIEESMEEISQNLTLTPEDKNRLQKRKKSNHQKGFLATRKLFLAADIDPSNLRYNAMGAPVLKSGKKLSISHSKTVAGIAYGTKPLGFDLECYQEKIINIANRFLHPEEDFTRNGDTAIRKLTLLWTAKEALYKAIQQPGIIFSQQLLIAPFEWGAENGTAKVFIQDKTLDFSLKFIVGKSYCGTLAVQNNL